MRNRSLGNRTEVEGDTAYYANYKTMKVTERMSVEPRVWLQRLKEHWKSNQLPPTQSTVTHDTGKKSVMGQEQDEVFVCSDENYDDVKPM